MIKSALNKIAHEPDLVGDCSRVSFIFKFNMGALGVVLSISHCRSNKLVRNILLKHILIENEKNYFIKTPYFLKPMYLIFRLRLIL